MHITLGKKVFILPTAVVGLSAGRLLSRAHEPGFRGLLGRSSLQGARFEYDGAKGTFDIDIAT